ncbi:MAG: PC4/YdbC family ssDNA-binding protein [Sandaracinaceae bacterium]
MADRYDPVSEEEAAALGQAVLARIRGEPLTPSQSALLARGRSEAREERAPGPVLDVDEVVLRLPRGAEAEIRVSLRSYRGSDPFLDLRRWERTAAGAYRPTRQGVTVRRREIGRLLSALVQLAGRLDEPEDGDER